MPVDIRLPGPWAHRYLSAGGTRFHAAVAGPQAAVDGSEDAGPIVILLHGFPQCWWTWRRVLPPIADAGYRVAAVDLRGCGGSDRPPSGYDLVCLADDVHGCVQALGHESAVIVGHGVGGHVAWVMARRFASTIRGIIPVSSPHPVAVRSLRGRLMSGAALQYLSLTMPLLPERTLSTHAGMERLLRSWAGPRTRAAVSEAAGYYADLFARPGAARSALQTLRGVRLGHATQAALASEVEIPVLSIQGQVDPVQPAQAYARDTHYVAGRLQQVTIRGVGHFPQEEDPEALTEVLLPFFADVIDPRS